MKLTLALILLSAVIATPQLRAQSTNNAFPLWAGEAPGALGKTTNDIPTLTPFLPDADKASGAAVVICPGGGYAHLAMDHEGYHYARLLNELGIAGFVLKYRLGSSNYRHPAMLQDAARALRIVRARADEWHLDPKRIGIMGSSAGGHLASTLLTHYDAGKSDDSDPVERVSSRPDLGILCYAVITLGPGTHGGSRDNLLGKNPSPELIALLSNEQQVTTNTPPTFLWSTDDDRTVPVANSLNFAAALAKAKVPFSMKIIEHGPHGLGLGTRDWNPAKRLPWTSDLAYWLKQRGFTK